MPWECSLWSTRLPTVLFPQPLSPRKPDDASLVSVELFSFFPTDSVFVPNDMRLLTHYYCFSRLLMRATNEIRVSYQPNVHILPTEQTTSIIDRRNLRKAASTCREPLAPAIGTREILRDCRFTADCASLYDLCIAATRISEVLSRMMRGSTFSPSSSVWRTCLPEIKTGFSSEWFSIKSTRPSDS